MKTESRLARHVHQGDVYVMPLGSPPDVSMCTEEPEAVAAYGETTGHKHQFHGERVRFFRADEMRAFLLVEGDGATLMHEEHGHHRIAPGWYEVRRQREASLEEAGWRAIAD